MALERSPILLTILPSSFKGIGGAELHWFRLLFVLSYLFPNMKIKAICGTRPRSSLTKNVSLISFPLIRLTECSWVVLIFFPIIWFIEFFFMALLLIRDIRKVIAIHITMGYPRVIPFIVFSKLLKKIVIMEIHGFTEISRFWKLSSKYLSLVDIMITTNKVQYIFFKKKRLGHTVILIPALGSVIAERTSEELCKEINARSLMHGISIAYFGGEKRVKGFFQLLKLLSLLTKDSRIKYISLFGRYTTKTIDLITRLTEDSPKIKLRGLIPHKDVITEMRKHDIILGAGLVAHEALSQCRPVVLWYDFGSVCRFDVIGLHYDSISKGLVFLPTDIKDYKSLLEEIINFFIYFSQEDPKILVSRINNVLYNFNPRIAIRRYYTLFKKLQRCRC